MNRKFIKLVTVTGADDSVKHGDLVKLSREFPFVEFGILLSKSSMGCNRFPSKDWLLGTEFLFRRGVRLSGHLCGSWVRDICNDSWSFLQDARQICPFFWRFQINTHATPHGHSLSWSEFPGGREFIFQMDGVNEQLLPIARSKGYQATGLFDLSHGAGICPDNWPESYTWMGYAGGLGPENVVDEIYKIEKICAGPIWIDAETNLRSNHDLIFDLNKVAAFLEAAKPFIIVT